MKKLAALVGSMMLFAATTASAEHRLLVTDVVDPGHVEGEVAWEFVHVNQDLKGNVSELGLSLGVGVLKNLELDFSVPFVLKEEARFDGLSERGKGWGDLTVGAKYKILNENPVTLTTSFDIQFDTGSKSISGEEHHMTYSPMVAISKDLGHETKPYALYRAAFDSNGPDAHVIAVGLEKELNHAVTLDVRFDTAFYVNGDPEFGQKDLKIYALDLATYLKVCNGFYLIPSVGISRYDFAGGDATGLKAGAAAYFIY